jgi:hypothetical protein
MKKRFYILCYSSTIYIIFHRKDAMAQRFYFFFCVPGSLRLIHFFILLTEEDTRRHNKNKA